MCWLFVMWIISVCTCAFLLLCRCLFLQSHTYEIPPIKCLIIPTTWTQIYYNKWVGQPLKWVWLNHQNDEIYVLITYCHFYWSIELFFFVYIQPMGIFVNSLCTSRFLTTYNPNLKNLDVTSTHKLWGCCKIL